MCVFFPAVRGRNFWPLGIQRSVCRKSGSKPLCWYCFSSLTIVAFACIPSAFHHPHPTLERLDPMPLTPRTSVNPRDSRHCSCDTPCTATQFSDLYSAKLRCDTPRTGATGPFFRHFRGCSAILARHYENGRVAWHKWCSVWATKLPDLPFHIWCFWTSLVFSFSYQGAPLCFECFLLFSEGLFGLDKRPMKGRSTRYRLGRWIVIWSFLGLRFRCPPRPPEIPRKN